MFLSVRGGAVAGQEKVVADHVTVNAPAATRTANGAKVETENDQKTDDVPNRGIAVPNHVQIVVPGHVINAADHVTEDVKRIVKVAVGIVQDVQDQKDVHHRQLHDHMVLAAAVVVVVAAVAVNGIVHL